MRIRERYPEARVNYRSNLHIHVRVPGLCEDLDALKCLVRFNQRWLPELLPLVEPIPRPWGNSTAEQKGAQQRYRRRVVSHHTITTGPRVEAQLLATSPADLLAAAVPWSAKIGRPQWQLAAREAVNIRQLRETDTIEFRHFPGTLDARELLTCVEWCRDYLRAAFDDRDPIEMYKSEYAGREWPVFESYVHWMEVRYRATRHGGKLKRARVEQNIRAILDGDFGGGPLCCATGPSIVPRSAPRCFATGAWKPSPRGS